MHIHICEYTGVGYLHIYVYAHMHCICEVYKWWISAYLVSSSICILASMHIRICVQPTSIVLLDPVVQFNFYSAR